MTRIVVKTRTLFSLHSSPFSYCSHTIHKVRFGDDLPDVHHPLDGITRANTPSNNGVGTQFAYFTNIVPSSYTPRFGSVVKSNQISVTEHVRTETNASGMWQRLPGVFIFFEYTPIRIDMVDRVMPFLSFLTSVCAIVGGVFTVVGLIEGSVHGVRGMIGGRKAGGSLGGGGGKVY